MDKQAVLRKIAEIGIVPVVRVGSSAEGQLVAEALGTGGIPIVEITLTVPGAVDLIRKLRQTSGPHVVIGAGTVLDARAARESLEAGAQFLVSPALDVDTIELASREGVAMIAGALTPTEIVTAWRAGSDYVKVFPCGTAGGAKYIRALKGPLPQIPLIPTGGVSLDTAAELLEAGAEALGVGSELIQTSALRAGKPEVIVELACRFRAIVSETRARMAQNSAAASPPHQARG
jgi:2-dehydro-3-deoxyphosphogluconate aldolase / (4S)-4-hydroxy-2-oxoglutarate aldolase